MTKTTHIPRSRSLLTVLFSFVIMLCLGGIYAWSILVPELQSNYQWTSVQSQLVFGAVILVFPATMIFAGKLQHKITPRFQAVLSACFFGAGYLISGYSGGNFYLILLGTGILAGIGTGFGYLTALTLPVKWFPAKKGLVTGIVSAGFGLAAVVLTFLIEQALNYGLDIMAIFKRIGLGYGALILFSVFFLHNPSSSGTIEVSPATTMLRSKHYWQLVIGMFFGTFAGLLVLGNLSPIGEEHGLEQHILMVGVSVFAIANFAGRLSWGWISDYLPARSCIIAALLFQTVAVFLMGYLPLTNVSYLTLSILIGFGYGSNFVLFAKESAQQFGVANLATIFPYVFMGYAIAGIFGPLTGGYIHDLTSSFHYASYAAAAMSLAGALIFIISHKSHQSINPNSK